MLFSISRHSLIVALILVTGCQAEKHTASHEVSMPANDILMIDHQEFDRLSEGAEEILILDVRSPQEFAQGHIPGAINIPHHLLADRLDEISAFKDKVAVTYCESGVRTKIALDILQQNGFEKPGHLKGDMPRYLD